MTPLYLSMLLNIYVSPEPNFDERGPAVREALDDMLTQGLIVMNDSPSRVLAGTWLTTPRGEALVRMWCNTPLPVQVWRDPRETV